VSNRSASTGRPDITLTRGSPRFFLVSNEFGRFLAYLLLALQKAADGSGAQIRLILDTPQLPPFAPANSVW